MNILSNLIVITIPYSQIWALKTQWQIEGKKKKKWNHSLYSGKCKCRLNLATTFAVWDQYSSPTKSLLLCFVILSQLRKWQDWKTLGPWHGQAAPTDCDRVVTLNEKHEAWATGSHFSLAQFIRWVRNDAVENEKQRNEHTEEKSSVTCRADGIIWPTASNKEAVRHSVYGLKAPCILSWRW